MHLTSYTLFLLFFPKFKVHFLSLEIFDHFMFDGFHCSICTSTLGKCALKKSFACCLFHCVFGLHYTCS
uniref:Uncharacterized protein n=1 Tax=Rhizophora mucronata TaxID=61149 RepID=A0A2P2IQE1_RHIMU